MNIKGSQTEKNLLAAFTGESMARNKYLFFAEKARKEGNDEIADLFERMAQNEGIHGKMLFERLNGVKDSASNLQSALAGEYGEWTSMYPNFAQKAREEGFEEIAMLFDNIAKIEQDHEFRFMTALSNLYAKDKASSPTETPKQQERTVTAQGYRCVFCGAIFEERPDVCSVCEAIGSFEQTTYQKAVSE